MADPQYVIVKCPKGHELQAAQEHLSATLACPVCGVEFVPQSTMGASAGTAYDAPPIQAYAGAHLNNEPVDYPAITTWMIGLWVGVTVLSLLQSIIGIFMGPPPVVQPGQIPNVSGGYMAFALIFGCLMWAGLAVAAVVQLIWIYRVHKDAQRARGYGSISPGLAIGLSFIPAFNYIWTALTMLKLSAFVASSSGEADAETTQRISKAQSATRVCLIVGIVVVVASCLWFGYAGAVGWKAGMESIGPNGQMDQVAFNSKIQAQIGSGPVWVPVLINLVGVGIVMVYVGAVRKLEAALYPFLGAPPR